MSFEEKINLTADLYFTTMHRNIDYCPPPCFFPHEPLLARSWPYRVAPAAGESCSVYIYMPHANVPGGLVGGPRAYQYQFRGFEAHRVHARRDFFLHKKLLQAVAESVRA